MTSILLSIYGLYLIMVGINGNASPFFSAVGGEHQFLYWIIVMIIIAALWEAPVAEEFAKALAVLIVLGFLLHNNAYKTIGANLTSILSGTAPATT